MEKAIIKTILVGSLFVSGVCIVGVNGGVGLGLILMSIFAFISFMGQTIENEIEYQVMKRGGKVIEIERNKKYIMEVDEIEFKKRYRLEDVYRTRYSVGDHEKTLYLVLYRTFFNSKKLRMDWVEEDAS